MQNNATETTGSSIRHSSGSSGSSRPRKREKNQLPVGSDVLLAMIIIGLLLNLKNGTFTLYWTFDRRFGFILQKSRLCFIASLRSPCITGSTPITRAVLTAFAVTTIGFMAIKYGAFINGQETPGQSYITSISLATAIRGIMFEVDTVIADGCASGTLTRVGEGFAMQMLSLLFFAVGSLVGTDHMGWWTENFITTASRIFLPDVFGWMGAVVLQLVIIEPLYIAAGLYEGERIGNTEDQGPVLMKGGYYGRIYS